VTLPVEVVVAEEEVVRVVVEETRVESVLGFPTEVDVREEELVGSEHIPNRASHPVPQHPVELPQYCSKPKSASIVCKPVRDVPTPSLLQQFPKVDPKQVYPFEPPHVPSFEATGDAAGLLVPVAVVIDKQPRTVTAHMLSEGIVSECGGRLSYEKNVWERAKKPHR
jgi:hypothetical protein